MERTAKPLTVGIVGSGYASYLHLNGYKKISGIPVRIKAVADIVEEKAKKMAEIYGIEKAFTDYRNILDDKEIDVVDICTPPFLHSVMVMESFEAGKHVICEKPLTGYFGREGDLEPIGKNVSKKVMYEYVLEEIERLKRIVKNSDRLFMYAENYVYAPTIQKAAEIIRKRKSKILFMKGEESLAGSSSPLAGYWNKTGGGSLIRIGCHPLSGLLWLKKCESESRGENIIVKKVSCDVGVATNAIREGERSYIRAKPWDVEDVATLTLTFSDGTKALVIAVDTVLGGTNNYVEVYTSDSSLICRLTPPGCMDAYFLDEMGLEDVAIAEMLPTYIGWQHVFVCDEILRGYVGELQDFVECVWYDRKPLSDFDLAYETIRIIYAAYWSAEEGKAIEF
ncbi:MAG: Gfo/Idh/MocA family oxidoreductase [Synergistetes bacterium]|nr:Gfo/Idh/MocA family oxidoreductase [Synergistota bacterium]MCX8127580.1 Gfo/Idh/MocA family oxidoreductase [Synergistota bacterium]MDW8191503.1 Gfo/Idh/MocA family oxidoreductase [Synergistota bacterium]